MEILISPLGLSPGAVSGAAFALRRKGHDIRRVITLGTSEPEIIQSAGYLRPLFEEAEIDYEEDYIPQPDLKQDDRSVATFVARMGRILEKIDREQHVVHVGVTAGRSGMGALAALAASLYGAHFLWHFWVSAEIELGGRIGDLPQPVSMANKYVNPPATLCDLVALPFVDLQPLHEQLWRFYGSGELVLPDDVSKMLRLFTGGEMVLGDVFPAGATRHHLEVTEEMVGRSAQATDSDRQQMQATVMTVLNEAGLIDRGSLDTLDFIFKLDQTPLELLALASQLEGRSRFWGYLQARMETIAIAVAAGKRVIDRVALHQNMNQHFSNEELNELCFRLSVDHEQLGVEGKGEAGAKTRALIEYMARRHRLPELIAQLMQEQPGIDWLPDQTDLSHQDELYMVTETDLFLIHALHMWSYQRQAERSI